jgi:cytochrome b
MTKVWDLYIRSYHWLLVITIFSNLFINEAGEVWHERSGLFASALVLFRGVWGFVSPSPYARWHFFWPTPSRVLEYGRQFLRRKHPRMLSHNPFAAIVMIALMTTILCLGLTGWLQGTDRYWGYEPLQDLHVYLGNFLMTLIAVHILGVFHESWRTGENLTASMIHGKKRGTSADAGAPQSR